MASIPAIATTGYGLVQEAQDGSLRVGGIRGDRDPVRDALAGALIALLYTQLSELLLLHHPDSGAVEKLFFQRNVRTAMTVGQARGVALLALAQAGLPAAEYTPLEVKQAVVGYGGADKNQVQQMVRALLGFDDIPDPTTPPTRLR